MAETIFGEATVVLRGDLRQLEADLRQGEALIEQQTQQIAVAQARAAEESAGGGGGGAVALGMLSMVRAAHLVGIAMGVAEAAFQRFVIAAVATKTAVTAAAVATTAFVAGGIAALIGSVGVAIGLIYDLGGAIVRFDRWMQDVSITMDDVTQAFGRLAVKMEDGRAQWTLLGAVARETIGNIIKLLSDLSGGAIPDLNAEAERAIKLQNRMADQIAAIERIGPAFKGAADGMRELAINAERAAALEGLEGWPRILMETKFAAEDVAKAYDDTIRNINRQNNALRESAAARLETEEITQEAYNAELRSINVITDALHRAAIAERERADAAIQARSTDRVDQFNAQANQQFAQQQAAERDESIRGEGRIDTLQTQTRIAQLEAQDKRFEAQREQLELARRQSIREANANQRDDEVALIEGLYDAKLQALQAGEARMKAEQERLAEERAMSEQQAMEQVRSRILEERLRQAGRDVEAQAEAIRRASERAIDEAMGDGNEELADQLRTLRDLRIGGLDDSSASTFGFREMGRDRLAAGGTAGDGEMRVKGQDEVVNKLTSIDQKLSDREALFG